MRARTTGSTRRLGRRLVAGLLLAVATVSLTACADHSSTDTAFDTWYAQMQTVLDDPNGVGGGGGATPGSVALGTMHAGRWVVFAVCNHTNVLHVQIMGGSTVLAETDVPCGATIGIPVTVDSAAARRFEIRTRHHKGDSGTGWWEVEVNSPSWKQLQSFGFD